jgi:hypothetical protein
MPSSRGPLLIGAEWAQSGQIQRMLGPEVSERPPPNLKWNAPMDDNQVGYAAGDGDAEDNFPSLIGSISRRESLPWTYSSARWAVAIRQLSEGLLP